MMLLRHSHGKGGRPQTRCIHNDMDEAEVSGPVRRCALSIMSMVTSQRNAHTLTMPMLEQDHPPIVDVGELHMEDKQCTGLGQTLSDMLFRNNMFIYLFG